MACGKPNHCGCTGNAGNACNQSCGCREAYCRGYRAGYAVGYDAGYAAGKAAAEDNTPGCGCTETTGKPCNTCNTCNTCNS